MKKDKMGYIKESRQYTLDKATLQLKSKALHRGQVVLSSGEILTFINGQLEISKDLAKKLLSENNDFEEAK